jgi:hypothetical protein
MTTLQAMERRWARGERMLRIVQPVLRFLARRFRFHIGRFGVRAVYSLSTLDYGWLVQVMGTNRHGTPFASGAGYRGGATLFIGWHTVGGGRDMYRPSGLRIGLTQNAHKVPYVRH